MERQNVLWRSVYEGTTLSQNGECGRLPVNGYQLKCTECLANITNVQEHGGFHIVI